MTGQQAAMAGSADATPLFRAWTRVTLAGWLLGIPSIVVFALAGESVGPGGRQICVGRRDGLLAWRHAEAADAPCARPGHAVILVVSRRRGARVRRLLN